MNRAQIYLPRSQQIALKREALKRNTTVSAVIRMIVQEKLLAPNSKKTVPKPEGLLKVARRINKLGQKGPPDLAINLDEYLYVGKR